MAIVPFPTLKQPSEAEDIVGFNLEPTGGVARPLRYVTFGQAFEQGKVQTDTPLIAKIGTADMIPAQMDFKTKHPDGSVRFAAITVESPDLLANAPIKAMLAIGGTIGTKIPILKALKDYNCVLTFTGGINLVLNLGERLIADIRAQRHSFWLRGENAVRVRIDWPLVNSVHLTADVTAYANGTFQTDLQFRNDYSMSSMYGHLNYAVKIEQNGAIMFNGSVNHLWSKTWRRVFHTDGAPTHDTHNVQHDIAYLIEHGVLQNYALDGMDDQYVENYTSTNIPPLSNPGWYAAMPSGGHRGDIGPMPEWYARWIKSQSWKAARAALVMGNGAGSIPWHHFDPATNEFISLDKYPTLWIDDSDRGETDLLPDLDIPDWWLDNAHAPDVAFIPYLMTADQYYLDELNAQSSRQLAALWNAPRQDGKGIAVVGSDAFEVRAQVWTFRNIIESAWANPHKSAAQTYWLKMLDNNYDFILNSIMPEWTEAAGEVAGYFYGVYGYTQMAVWQQDYMVSVLAIANGLRPRNNSHALKMIKWAQNFNVGRATHQAQGFGWASAVSYQMNIANSSRVWYDTWAELGAANEGSNALPQDGGAWVPLFLMTLATIYNHTGDAVALAKYNELKAMNPPGISYDYYQRMYPQFHIVPKTA